MLCEGISRNATIEPVLYPPRILLLQNTNSCALTLLMTSASGREVRNSSIFNVCKYIYVICNFIRVGDRCNNSEVKIRK